MHTLQNKTYKKTLKKLEKLVEGLKLGNAEALHTQIFVCLRVLLTRIHISNLAPIWPLIITETIRTFEIGQDKSLLLAVSKFIDTALILLPQHFQLFKWSFVQETHATNPPTPRHQNRLSKPSSATDVVGIGSQGTGVTFIPQLQLFSQRLQEENTKNRSEHVTSSEHISLKSPRIEQAMRGDKLESVEMSIAHEIGKLQFYSFFLVFLFFFCELKFRNHPKKIENLYSHFGGIDCI